jgi:hypothetical protein
MGETKIPAVQLYQIMWIAVRMALCSFIAGMYLSGPRWENHHDGDSVIGTFWIAATVWMALKLWGRIKTGRFASDAATDRRSWDMY